MLCIALLLVTSAVGALATAAAADAPQPTIQDNSSDENTTDTTPEDSDAPTQAEMLRVTPDNPEKEYLSIETESSDEAYNTSGPYATFSLSEPVQSVRVGQSGADATVLGDGSVVRVEYDEDAAGENASLYTAELFFADGSEHQIDLYAHDTDVSLEAAEYAEYGGLIDYVTEQAGGEGFETTPEGAQAYVEHKEERADLFDHMFSEHVMMFLTLLMMAARNFVTWVVAIAIIAGLAIYFERKHGWILRLQQMAESRAELMREAVRQDYEERRNAAAKHSLEDVSEVGPNAARYWRELGVETVDDMIEVACKGVISLTEEGRINYDENGNVVYAHHGVDDLKDVDPLTLDQLRSQTWLGPLILEGRLAPTTALSNIESALLVAEKEYNRGNEVRDARRTVSELNARLRGQRDFEDAETSSNAARPNRRTDYSGAATGGD
ncbi:hypothetical protein [Natronorubrum texcoconense]|uniref:Uncharacterized protein n=1 Tax=Natronorubrum texcoconense TaxID=1095776 RepID=A0A1G9H8H6_9EURY|nr:hypothetical protein [Natronorubrum texcoconense]SDL09145.1 hypothetical protein SAMN04515672_0143 [Natronorubrum texcoconense]